MKKENKNVIATSGSDADEFLFELAAETLQQHVAAYERLAFDAWREGRE